MRTLADRLLDFYVQLFLKIEPDGEVKLSLLANVLIGIGYGIAGCLLMRVAEVQMGR